jgi:two-component system response regulator HydG
MTHILVVDDDPQMRMSLAHLLRREAYTVSEAGSGEQAVSLLGREAFDLVITDLHMEPLSGLDVLRQIKQTHPHTEVIVVTAFGSIETAVDAMKLKAFDYVTKPFQVDEILLRVRNALEKSRLAEQVHRLRNEAKAAFGIDGIVGQSEALRCVLSQIPKIAETDATVLITGESGTGKELVARAIGSSSRRANGPFVSVSCAALPEQLLESELFGHVKGAYTTAVAARKGLIEEASGGTFFLDEIGEASLAIQVKLLRVLEERALRRIGDNRSIPVDVRIVAATNRDPEQMIKAKTFREDLFFRLNVVRLQMPPLRERVEDIPLLADHFIAKYNQKMNKGLRGVSRDTQALLMAYHWPGNVRELENVIQRSMITAEGERLEVADMPAEIRGEPLGSGDQSLPGRMRRPTEMIERKAIMDMLKQHGGNITRTAKALGISRATLQNKMKKLHISAVRDGAPERENE